MTIFLRCCRKRKEVELGEDIIIALETMENQSLEQEIGFNDHYVHILIHGILHLLGYDHIEEAERLEMEALTRRCRQKQRDQPA